MRDRLAVTLWLFLRYIESPINLWRHGRLPGIGAKDYPAFIAEKFLVFNINPKAEPLRSTNSAYLAAFREVLVKAHFHVVDLGLGRRDFYASDSTIRDLAFSFGRPWIDRACEIGSLSVHQHLKLNARGKPDLERTIRNLGRLVEYRAKRNLVVNLENDNPIARIRVLLCVYLKR
jgi:sugar phosphate isomerase/epimerase